MTSASSRWTGKAGPHCSILFEDQQGKCSTIITSQMPVSGWYDIIGEQTVADAILDRIVYQAIRT